MLPTSFIAGENLSWEIEIADYSAIDGWAVAYHFRGPSLLNVSGVANGDGFEFAITPAQSAALQPGRYFYQAFATKSTTDTKLVAEGQIEVKASLASATAGYDGRSYNEITFEAITKALNGIGTDGVLSYTVAQPNGTSREIRNIPPTELMELHKYFGALVAQERAAKSGGSVMGTQYFSFSRR